MFYSTSSPTPSYTSTVYDEPDTYDSSPSSSASTLSDLPSASLFSRLLKQISSGPSLLSEPLDEAAKRGQGPLEAICIGGVGGSSLADAKGNQVYPNSFRMALVPRYTSCLEFRDEEDELKVVKMVRKIAIYSYWHIFKGVDKKIKVHEIPYDFRRTPSDCGPYVLKALEEIKASRPPGTRFIAIAHSYGGVVLADALSRSSDLNLVEGVIALGSPFLGSASSADKSEYGMRIMGLMTVRSATLKTFPIMAFLDPSKPSMAEWRDQVQARSPGTALSSVPFVCVAASLWPTSDGPLVKSRRGTAPGDDVVTFESATQPPGVDARHLFVLKTRRVHHLLQNARRSVANAISIINDFHSPRS